jgi:hypothetical protein
MSFSISDLLSPKNDLPQKAAASPTSGDTTKGTSGTKHEAFLGKNTYTISEQNWYTAKPYGFKARFKNGGSAVMFLPINPNNISITTNFATNVISTLYGTVEEHSEVRYYDITISGTTGMAPRFVSPDLKESGDVDPGAAYSSVRRKGRSTFSVANSLSAGGFFAKTLGIANQIKQKAADLLDGGPKAKTGISPDNSGYVAFHNLYRFLLQYKKDASGTSGKGGTRKHHPLTFFNYKDNNQYDVAVRGFTMVRSADNPMLYNYTIQLRGYNLQTSNRKAIDEDLTKRLEDLGLSGVDGSSLLGNIKSISSQAKGIIGSFVGGINVLGR